ncbi:KH domain-containing protein HEN4 [Linum perenne]
MDATYLSLPSKRTINYPTGGMSDSNKRFKHFPPSPNQHHQQQQQSVPSGHVCFRLLCHSSRVGGVIGKSGSIVKQLVQQTGAKIRVEDAPADCPDRAITVLAPAAVCSRISFPTCNGFAGAEFDVSKAQEALVRVLERVLEVAAETDGGGVPEGRIVSCRLLAEGIHAGSVIGKGGKVVEKIKKDFGVKIRVMKDKLPLCAASTEEMIEIEGEVMGVKRALVSVSRCLQESQLSDRTRMSGSKPVEVVPRDFPDMRLNVLSQHASMPGAYTSGGHSLSLESDRMPNLDNRTLLEEVAFRILCSNDRVGGIIGSGGSIIRSLQEETGASIVIGASVPECDERLITIAASENPESRYSAAQKATVLVFSRAIDAGIERGLGGSLKGSPVTARIVVSSNNVGCLLGKGGTIVSEMRNVTGAGIRVLGRDQLPRCVQENDQVISGELVNVRDAIYHVTGRLRDNLFSGLLSSSMTRSTTLSSETNPYGSMVDLPRIPVKETLRDSSRESYTDLYGYQPEDPSRESFVDQYRYASGEPLRESFNEPLRNPLRDSLRDSFRDPLGDSLRDALTDTFRDPLNNPMRDPTHLSSHFSVGASHDLGRHSTLAQGIDHLGLSHGQDQHPSPKSWTTQITGANTRGFTDVSRGLSSFKGGLESARFVKYTYPVFVNSFSRSAIVTNTTVEIVIPESVISCVYGENGNNLLRLRQISGAKVIVHEPRVGSSDRIIVISGTPDETQAAQSLLQAFILTGQS